jgi:hypothetical protein
MMPDDRKNPNPEWEYKEEFGIVSQLKQAVRATQKASEQELAELRRRLERITYGS